MQTGAFYGIVKNPKSLIRCVFCGVFIPKANRSIEEHINGAKHKDNIDLMTENAMVYSNEEVFCKPCNVNLKEEESVASHIESDEHANWTVAINDLIDGEFINIDLYLAIENGEIFCEACDCEIHCDLNGIESHVNGNIHRTNVAETLKPMNAIFSAEDEHELWCKVCKEYIENTPQSVFSHIDSNNFHINWMNEVEDLIEDQDISIDDFLGSKDINNAYCNKCEESIPCVVQNIILHLNTDRHSN